LSEYIDHFKISEGDTEKVLSAALSRGCDFSDLFFEHSTENIITMEEGIVKEGLKSVSMGVGIRCVKGEGTGYAYTEELSLDKMMKAALTAAAIADSESTPAPASYRDIEHKDYYPLDRLTTDEPLKRKTGWIEQAEKAARDSDPSIIKVSVTLADSMRTVRLITSDGRSLRDVRPMTRISVSAIGERNGNRQVGISSGGGRMGPDYFTDKTPAEHGSDAARQALLLLEAIDAPAGQMEIILAPAESGILLHESVGHPLEADFIRKKTSAYTGRVGDKVASELVTVIDDGTVMYDRGSLNFDDEGVLTEPTVLIENGILKGFMQDRISASFFETSPTGNGRRESYRYPPMPRMTVTYLANGETDPGEIFASTKKGIYCKSFKGGQVDISNGDFVFVPIEAYLVENGKITVPVKNLTLTGNGPEVLSRVTHVGNDFAFSDGRWTCGKGQSVPVGVGLPTIKISGITVGGSELG
jgi:TldD protein